MERPAISLNASKPRKTVQPRPKTEVPAMSALIGKFIYAIFAPIGLMTIMLFSSGRANWAFDNMEAVAEPDDGEKMICRYVPQTALKHVDSNLLKVLKWCDKSAEQ